MSDTNDIRLQEEHGSIEAEAIQSDTQAAIDLLQDLQSQYETVSETQNLRQKASID